MNKLTKIGVSALAGSLAMTAVHAAEGSVSVSTGFAFASTTDENLPTGPYQFDSVVFSASGETDGGITVSAKMELDNDNPASTDGMDDRSVSFGTDALGTVTFHGHGGSSVMGQWDDMTPNAYEEVWDTTTGADVRIDGRSGDNLFTYDSPSFNGVMFKAAFQAADNSASTVADKDLSAYTDFGIMISPEMVEGLRIGFASADHTIASASNRDQEETTYYATYAMGGFTVGVQVSDLDDTTANSDQESIAYGVTYAVNDDLTIGYNYHELETESATDSDQESTAIGASFTSGSMTIGGSMNTADNMSGIAATDREGYEFSVSFAF